MRVYHFVNEKFGIEDLRMKRLKIATLHELNDPFDFFGVNLSNKSVRNAFKTMKDGLSVNRGLLCFSRDWHNPVQWSHYADKHRGLCLGFDVPDEKLGIVSYSRKRLVIEVERLVAYREETEEMLIKFLFTKYYHWRYEKEVRCFVTLKDRDFEKKKYFADFSDNLKLVKVIVGAESTLTREAVLAALDDLVPSVDVIKARLAFNTFNVVTQKNKKLWI